MARLTVRLPAVLLVVTGTRRVDVEAATVGEALEELLALHPHLRVHLFEEDGAFRPHVLVFHNDVNVRWRPGLDAAVADGDELTIMQAVSGGQPNAL